MPLKFPRGQLVFNTARKKNFRLGSHRLCIDYLFCTIACLYLNFRCRHARKHFTNLEEGQLANVQKVMGLLAFTPNTQIEAYKVSVAQMGPGGRFKNTCEFLDLRASQISILDEICIFQCMCKIICVEFQREPLKFHTKYLTYTLKDVHFI